MCLEMLIRKSQKETWKIIENLLWNTMQWDNPTNKHSTLPSTNKSGIYSADGSVAIKAKITAPMWRIRALETPSAPQVDK